MNFPFVKQLDSMDCGPACLSMVVKYYGKTASLEMLREKSQIGKEGVNILGISEAAELMGFRTRSLKLDYNSLCKEAILPAILHWDQNHFVVLYKTQKRKLHLADPGRGLVEYDVNEFKSKWISDTEDGVDLGIALLLEPTPKFYNEQTDFTQSNNSNLNFKNIFDYILPHKRLIIQLFIGLGAGSILQVFLPFLMKSVVDVGVNTSNIHFVYIVLIAQMALFTGRLVIDFVRSWILLHISTRINVSILTDFLIKLMTLPVSFFDSRKTGDVMQRMNDHKRIEAFLTGSSISVLFSIVNLLLFSFVLAAFNSTVFAVFVGSSMLYTLWVLLFLKRRKTLDYERFDVASKEQSTTIQLIQGMQEIKLNGVEKSIRWKWERLQAKLFKLTMKNLSLNQWQQSGAFFINEGKNILITFISAKSVIDGQMTLGSMLAVQYIIGQLNSPIEQMIGFIQSFQNAKISMDRLNEIHSTEEEEPAYKNFAYELPAGFTKYIGGKSYNKDLQYELMTDQNIRRTQAEVPTDRVVSDEIPSCIPSGLKIKFENISFRYPGAGNENVLNNINLSIYKGKTTAIVGVSGSGKTTLLKLLLKFYEPQNGEIRLGNTNLSNISHKIWRRNFGVVMQESFIFSDTIANNIAIDDERANVERLNNAVEIANIRDFIESLPLGFNTKIGSEGLGISMGQKQRILIARAVYRNPEFILFDEATNSLDASNESIIVHNLKSFLKNKTVLIVAHRLSTVKNADQIVVLNSGYITEKGTHAELVSLRGEYFNLVRDQLDLSE